MLRTLLLDVLAVLSGSLFLGDLLERETDFTLMRDEVDDLGSDCVALFDDVADGVAALSKDDSIKEANKLSKIEQLKENLSRIKAAPDYVACVKLADRCSNLKAFPAMWSREKIANYLDEAKLIADELGYASEGLHARLLHRIAEARMVLSIAKST